MPNRGTAHGKGHFVPFFFCRSHIPPAKAAITTPLRRSIRPLRHSAPLPSPPRLSPSSATCPTARLPCRTEIKRQVSELLPALFLICDKRLAARTRTRIMRLSARKPFCGVFQFNFGILPSYSSYVCDRRATLDDNMPVTKRGLASRKRRMAALGMTLLSFACVGLFSIAFASWNFEGGERRSCPARDLAAPWLCKQVAQAAGIFRGRQSRRLMRS